MGLPAAHPSPGPARIRERSKTVGGAGPSAVTRPRALPSSHAPERSWVDPLQPVQPRPTRSRRGSGVASPTGNSKNTQSRHLLQSQHAVPQPVTARLLDEPRGGLGDGGAEDTRLGFPQTLEGSREQSCRGWPLGISRLFGPAGPGRPTVEGVGGGSWGRRRRRPGARPARPAAGDVAAGGRTSNVPGPQAAGGGSLGSLEVGTETQSLMPRVSKEGTAGSTDGGGRLPPLCRALGVAERPQLSGRAHTPGDLVHSFIPGCSR